MTSSAKPNLLLIISDDMGYADLPKYGPSRIKTPNLDRLADEGVLFTDAYVSAPICTPSRMGMLSGRYHQRWGVYNLARYHGKEYGAFEGEATLPKLLAQDGYATGLVGKWHMGSLTHTNKRGDPLDCGIVSHPFDHGFDEFIGIPYGMSDYGAGAEIHRGREVLEAPEYLTDLFGNEASDFIDRHAGHPFFLMLSFNAVHAPLQATDADLMEVEEFDSPDRKTYAAMLESMDKNIGKVLDALDRHRLADNTLVLFINDNGGGGNNAPAHTRNTAMNAPLKGFKFDVYEGGVRVPMMMRWPERLQAKAVFREMVSGLDILPTFCDAAGVGLPDTVELDGVSLLPCLEGSVAGNPHPALYWINHTWQGPPATRRPEFTRFDCGMRKGTWKLIRRSVDRDLQGERAWELYNLEYDIGEQHDLAAEHREPGGLVECLSEEFTRWRRATNMHHDV